MKNVGIIAIHGGNIEPGTSEIAKGIAGDIFLLYVNNKGKHIPSNLFKDKEVIRLLEKVDVVLSIHGEKNNEYAFVMVGGLEKELVDKLEKALVGLDFEIKTPPENLDGDNPLNICNKGKSGKGVQLEISRKLRDNMINDSELMKKFYKIIQRTLVLYSK